MTSPTASTGSAARARLIDIVAARSFANDREITLASGRTSMIYFNLKPTMLHAEGATLIADATLDLLGDDDVAFAGGLEMGAVPLAANLAQASFRRGHPVSAFFVRKKAKEHGAKLLVEGLAPGESLRGARVAVLEDVTTTGGSALQAIEQVEEAGAIVTRVVTVVDREEGAAEAFAARGVVFTPILRASDFAGR